MNYTISEAIEVLQTIGADCGYGSDILATCIFMENNRRDFEPFEIMALDKFMAVGREFFAVKEAV
jgi:hypothetical protein